MAWGASQTARGVGNMDWGSIATARGVPRAVWGDTFAVWGDPNMTREDWSVIWGDVFAAWGAAIAIWGAPPVKKTRPHAARETGSGKNGGGDRIKCFADMTGRIRDDGLREHHATEVESTATMASGATAPAVA